MNSRPGIRGALVAAVVSLIAAACSSGSTSSDPDSIAGPCAPKPGGGALCITVNSTKGEVDDVIGYLSSSESPLAGKRWRLVLRTYPCDPGTDTTPACAATGVYPGPTRHGVPPIQSDCRRSDGTTDTTSTGCHNTLAQETATLGEWSGFPLPNKVYTVMAKTWLCVSEQVKSTSGWSAPTVATTPIRGCSTVSPN